MEEGSVHYGIEEEKTPPRKKKRESECVRESVTDTHLG